MKRNPNRHAHADLRDAVDVTRFWSLVDQRGEDDCWPWTGDTNRDYGVFHWHGRIYGAHELALSFTTGEVRLASLDTCHSCDNPICCNPRHLRFGTRRSNVAEMHERGRDYTPTKITDEQVLEIRERRALGARQLDLAEQYGVSDGTISLIVRGLRRQQAGGPIESERKYHRGK